MKSSFDDSFFGGTVCGSWLALGSVAALGLAGAVGSGRGSRAGSPPPGWTRGQVYGELKRLLRENKKLRVRTMRIGTGPKFEFGLYGPDADLVARSLERGGLRVAKDAEPVRFVRGPLGDGTEFNPYSLDFAE